jgi:hypothetical protein
LRLHRNQRFSDFVERRVFAFRNLLEERRSAGVMLTGVGDQLRLVSRKVHTFEQRLDTCTFVQHEPWIPGSRFMQPLER